MKLRIKTGNTISYEGVTTDRAKEIFEDMSDDTARRSHVERFDQNTGKWIIMPHYWGLTGFSWGTYGA